MELSWSGWHCSNPESRQWLAGGIEQGDFQFAHCGGVHIDRQLRTLDGDGLADASAALGAEIHRDEPVKPLHITVNGAVAVL